MDTYLDTLGYSFQAKICEAVIEERVFHDKDVDTLIGYIFGYSWRISPSFPARVDEADTQERRSSRFQRFPAPSFSVYGTSLHCLMLWQVIKMVSKRAGRMMGR